MTKLMNIHTQKKGEEENEAKFVYDLDHLCGTEKTKTKQKERK